MKKLILSLFLTSLSFNVFAESPVDFDQQALKALMASAPSMSVTGDIEADKLSDVLAEALYTYNTGEITLQVYNQCVMNEGGKGMQCRLSISDSDGEIESAIILTYQVVRNSTTGEVEVVSKSVNSIIAG